MIPVIGIYKIENIHTHKVYIGQSVNIYVRWANHKSELNRNKHGNSYLQNAWNKYGKNEFEFSILEECDKQLLNEKETYWVQFFKNKLGKNNVYNLGHTNSQNTMGDEQRNKISISKKKFYQSHPEALIQMRENSLGEKNGMYGIYGVNHPRYGKHHTTKTKNKLRSVKLGTKQSEETKKKKSLKESGVNNPMYGKHHSLEARLKISLAHKKMKSTEATKAKISLSSKNRVWINNGEINKFIKKEALQEYLDSNWKPGRIEWKGK